MDFELELSPAAKRDLKRLPLNIHEEILFKHLPMIKEKPFKVGKTLHGALKGERSYHFGHNPEYRIIYFIEDKVVIVTIIGTRENIYKQARRRSKKR